MYKYLFISKGNRYMMTFNWKFWAELVLTVSCLVAGYYGLKRGLKQGKKLGGKLFDKEEN